MSPGPAVDPSTVAFDVVVPAFDEASHVGACLDHVLAQDHPCERVRVWVVDAGSTDDTAALVRAREMQEARLNLVCGERRLNAAQACNLGIAQGRAELVARVDAHTYPAPDYLARAAEILVAAGPEVACVGGQPEQVGETRFGRGVARARRSRFGVGGSIYADRRQQAFVDTVQGGVYRRSALVAVGGFNEGMLCSEDEELNWRLRLSGFRILLDTRLRFRYTTRSSWRAACRQYRSYGRGRARVLAEHPEFLRPRHLTPSLLVSGTTGLAIASVRSRRARHALAGLLSAYGASALAAGIRAASDEMSLAPTIAAGFTALHVGYGIGLLEGAVEVGGARLGRARPAPTVSER
jgi:succinoglycan biosynthesis protein ExoA